MASMRIRYATSLVTASLLSALLLAAPASATTCGWHVVPTPNARVPYSTSMKGIAVESSTDVWAVGGALDPSTEKDFAVSDRWNGSAWTRVPVDAGYASRLRDVFAPDASDAWAVGAKARQALIERWDGDSWGRASLSPSNVDGELSSIDGVSTTDAWAVGRTTTAGVQTPLIAHWDGAAWSVVASGGAAEGRLLAVSADAPDDAWAVGSSGKSELLEHWDGSEWSVVSDPPPLNGMYSVAAKAPDDVWVGGRQGLGHWDGTHWTPVGKYPPPSSPEYSSIVVVSPTDIWATTRNELVERWDGTRWELISEGQIDAIDGSTDSSIIGVGSDNVGRWTGTRWVVHHLPTGSFASGTLTAVSATSNHDVWAVGSYGEGGHFYYTLGGIIEHWDGTSWTLISLPFRVRELTSVIAFSPSDVWVGGYGGVSHWDGKTWSTPSGPPTTSLTGTSDTDLWSVGYSYPFQEGSHWDGSAWTAYRVPDWFRAVASVAPNDVWAVGTSPYRPKTMHWDGSSWSAVANPGGGSLDAVAASSASDVWAVGSLIKHWDGARWRVEQAPLRDGTVLGGVSATSATTAWAVGEVGTRPVIDRWDGSTWHGVLTHALEGPQNAFLNGVSSPRGSAWAVGSSWPDAQAAVPTTFVVTTACT
jgi:hypothetical protein